MPQLQTRDTMLANIERAANLARRIRGKNRRVIWATRQMPPTGMS